MKVLILSIFITFSFPLYAIENDVVCPFGNGTNTELLTHTGLVFSEQSFWHRWTTYFAGIEDVPIQIASSSKFYKDKKNENKEKVEQLIHTNCARIGGKIIQGTMKDFTRSNISYAGICVRDKDFLNDPYVKYTLVHTKGRAVWSDEQDVLKSNLKSQCEDEHNGELILEAKEINTYLEVSSYAAICKSKISN